MTCKNASPWVQGANLVFLHHLGSFNFGGGDELGQYYAKICKWFRSSVWFVSQRVRAPAEVAAGMLLQTILLLSVLLVCIRACRKHSKQVSIIAWHVLADPAARL